MRNINYTYLLVIFLLNLPILLSCAQNQIKIEHVDIEKMPKGLIYKGKVKEVLRWKDKIGDNIVLISETGEYPSTNENYGDYRDAELYAHSFLFINDSIKQSWKVYDFVKDCPMEIKSGFVKNTFQVTDLNDDGIGEVWIMYKVACYGDVSPAEMKIIMYQGEQKFAMRGRSRVKLSETEFEGGEYKFDKAFVQGPPEFTKFAKQLWNNNHIETWK